jgi:MinD-like ATPase involved in chromosome partitioning or flagellar assembly
MTEPTVALAFTPDYWVEELHRHLSDHGGARVRSVLIEPSVALDEAYDVLVAGHRWPALTRALVADVHGRGRAVLGVFDRAEPASRSHLLELGVDAVVESDGGSEAFVRAIAAVRVERASSEPEPVSTVARRARLVVVGGPCGTGRTEVAIQLALAISAQCSTALVDADDVAPAIAQRLQLAIEPNLRTAIEAAEHGRGDFDRAIARYASLRVVAGIPNTGSWAHVRPAEVLRVIDAVGERAPLVVVDGAGCLEDFRSGTRGRFATARALVGEADLLVCVCDAAPHGLCRLLAWTVAAQELAPDTPVAVVVNRAPSARFRRGEIYEEITASVPVVDVNFVPYDERVADAAWAGTPVPRGPFTRSLARLAAIVGAGQ